MGSVDSLTDLAHALELFFKGLSECGLLAMYSVQLQVTSLDFVLQVKFQCLLQQILRSLRNILLKLKLPGQEYSRSVSTQTLNVGDSTLNVKQDNEQLSINGELFKPVAESCTFTHRDEPICWTTVHTKESATFVVPNNSEVPSTDIVIDCHSSTLTTANSTVTSNQTGEDTADKKCKNAEYSEELVEACNIASSISSLSLKKSSSISCDVNKTVHSNSCKKHSMEFNSDQPDTVDQVNESKCLQQAVEPLILHTYEEEHNNGESPTVVHIVVASTDSKDGKRYTPKLENEDRKPFECKECDKSFSTAHSLEIHFSRKHGTKGQCDMCTMRFSSIQSLQEHCRLEHGGTGCFTCPVCNRRFMKKLSFKRHVDIHAGKKGAVCDMCGKTFSRADYLSKHYMTHSGARPLSCSRCPRKFISSSHLKNHEKIHTGVREHVCELCHKPFSRGDKLKEHMLRHLNIKRFQCAVCKRHYAEKRDLRKHMRIHE